LALKFSGWPDQVVALQEKVTQNQGMVVKLAREGIFDAMKRSLNGIVHLRD
jgi:hypothetical protein